MKEISGSITITFICDACESETTPAPLPNNWRRITLHPPSHLSGVGIQKHMGPVCLASVDPDILDAIQDMVAE